MLFTNTGFGVAQYFAALGRAGRSIGCVFFDINARALGVSLAVDLDLAFEHIEHLVIGVAMHGNVGIRSPMANHHLRPRAAGRDMQPLGKTSPALDLLDLFLIDDMNCHESSGTREI